MRSTNRIIVARCNTLRRDSKVLRGLTGLSGCGSFTKSVSFANDGDVGLGNREALRIAHQVKTNLFACGNRDVLIDDAAPQLCALTDRDTFEEQRIFNDGAFFYTNVRE